MISAPIRIAPSLSVAAVTNYSSWWLKALADLAQYSQIDI
jgi:hypothetical protein